MVIFGGLELVAAGYIVHKHNKNKREKQRLEAEAASVNLAAAQPFPQRRKHSHERRRSRDRKHSHDKKHTYDGRRPSNESRPQQPQYLYADTSQPPRAHSAPPQGQVYPPQVYPPTGFPTHWNAPPEQQFPYNYAPPPAYPQQQQQQPQPPPPFQTPPPFDASRNLSEKAMTQPQDIPARGRATTPASYSASELSASGPRTYNTHLSPTPHVRFAVPNDAPQPGDGHQTPPPEYRV